MTYTSADESIEGGNPVEYYKFSAGSEINLFTNAHEEKTFLVQTYLPVEIARTQPRVNPDEPGSSLQVTFSLNDPAALQFLDNWIAGAPEVSRYKLTLSRQHLDDGGAVTFWIGFVVSAKYEDNGNQVTLLCKSLDNLFTLQGPRKNMGTTCNHKHFGTECALAATNFDHTTTVSSIDSTGLVYTLASVPAPTVRWEGGMFNKSGGFESRMMVLRAGNDITIQYPIPEIAVGDTVILTEGCKHDTVDCKAYPNASNATGTNIENFGGTPYTPTQNPFDTRLDLPFS